MIYRNKISGVLVRLVEESDGYGGTFGPEYWQIESLNKHYIYVGSFPYEMDRDKIEKSKDWMRIIKIK